MSTTLPQEQSHIQTDDPNTNFVKAEKPDPVHVQEKHPEKEEKTVSENLKKEHQEPKQNEQIPDQSGTSHTEKINVEPDQQHEKLPEKEDPEPSQKIEHNPPIQKQQIENQKTDLQKPESQPQEIPEKQPDQSHVPENENAHKNDENLNHQPKLEGEGESEQIHNEQEKPSDHHEIQPIENEDDSEKKIEKSPTNEHLNDNEQAENKEQELKSHPPGLNEEKPEIELEEKIGSIFNFFSVTKENITTTSQQTFTKLRELISKSNIVSFIQGNEYKPIITSDLIQSEKNETVPSTRRRKSHQRDQIKPRNESLENPIQTIKSPKKTNISTKTVDSQTPLVGGDKSIQRFKVKQPEAKNKNEIEDQIRQHKIQEIAKQKKALEMKLSALNDQLIDLQKVENSNSPNRAKSKPKETKEEFIQRKKRAVEFAKKMGHEQKAIEVRADQRREARQVLVNREIAALQQLADKKYERKKVLDYIRGQSEAQKKDILRAKYGMPSLEEKKLELKNKREFDKESLDPDFASQEDQQSKLTTKSSKKLYKSPLLPQVLANDAEQKKVETEKIAKRKALHDKQVDYGRGVKDIFLPKVQSKFEARKHKMGVYKSQQVDTYLLRAGKDGLYGYLDRMKNELEVNPVKPQKRPKKHKYEPFHEDDYDRPPTELEHDNEPDVNVAYGKQLVYELQDNWNLAEGTVSNRMMQNNNNHISPRNPPLNSKTPKKHSKKDNELFSDNYNTEENTYRSSKRVDDDENEEDL